jgi:two-component system NarL family sensor kinase
MKVMIKRIISIAIFFIITNIKAESIDSAFMALNSIHFQQVEQIDIQRKYELAKILYEEEEYSKAFEKILPLTELNIEDRELFVKINFLAGMILSKNNANDRSLSFLKKSYRLTKNYKSYDNLLRESYQVDHAKICLELSNLYSKLNKRDSSKYYIDHLLKIESVNQELLTIKARAYMNLGNMYTRQDSLMLGEKYIMEAIKIHESQKNNMSLALSYSNLASIYVKNEKYKKGRTLYGKALTYLKNEKSRKAIEYKELLYDNIAWALYNLKDYRAYKYVTDSYAIRDSLNTDKLKKDLKRIEAEHNVDMAVQQEQMKTEKQERKTWIIGVTGVVVSLLLLYLANLYKLRQQSLSLKLSKSQLEQQRNLERLKSQSQVKILNATIDGKETERKQIAEILHDNVSALLSSANMHLQASQKQFKDTAVPIELAKTQEIILEASQKIRELSHNLMSSVLLKFGLEYAVKDAAKKYSNSTIRINTAIHNVYRYSQEYEIKIFNIIQELINNILKHSEANNAYIMMEEEDDALHIIVKDDGKGFKNKSEEEKGVGINQIKARIHMMNGTFLIESSKGQGTKTTMSIPIIRSKTRVYSA